MKLVYEENAIQPGHHEAYEEAPEVDWTEPGLVLTRLRLISDPGFPVWDVSYCHGKIGEEPVVVRLPFDQIPKGKRFWRFLIAHGKRDRVYVKRLIPTPGLIISKLC